MNMVLRNLVMPFRCPSAFYFNATRFADTVEKLGVEPTGVECLSHNRKGFRLTLCSGEHEFSAMLDNSRVKLELVRLDGYRVPLAEGGAASQSTWDRFIQVVKEIK